MVIAADCPRLRRGLLSYSELAAMFVPQPHCWSEPNSFGWREFGLRTFAPSGLTQELRSVEHVCFWLIPLAQQPPAHSVRHGRDCCAFFPRWERVIGDRANGAPARPRRLFGPAERRETNDEPLRCRGARRRQ